MQPNTLIRRRYRLVVLAIVVLAAGSALPVQAKQPSPTEQPSAAAFEPRPLSEKRYEAQSPEADPVRQQHYVTAADQVELYVKTWLPVMKGGAPVGHRIPTVLVATPYEGFQSQKVTPHGKDHEAIARYFVEHGYAVSIASLRGTGRSGGCYDFGGPLERDDVARIVEYLGRDAPWSNGRVGMYGLSADATSQYAVATSPDKARTQYLKAIVPIAGVRSWYDTLASGGVPAMGSSIGLFGLHYQARVAQPETVEPRTAGSLASRSQCASTHPSMLEGVSGGWSPWFESHDMRTGAKNVTAAALYAQGLSDLVITPVHDVAFWDEVPKSTPRVGVVGQWEHFYPDRQTLHEKWRRADWLEMVRAWYDAYLLGLPVDVDSWPRVQVQDDEGQWRSEAAWPETRGPVRSLPLGVGGTLGAGDAGGTTTFSEVSTTSESGAAVFSTSPLKAPLHLTGEPLLSLWVVLQQPDAHVGVKLEAFAPDGRQLISTPVIGARSAQHLDAQPGERFSQMVGRPAPVGVPVRLDIRLTPLDVRIPVDGMLRLRIAGVTDYPSAALPGSPTGKTMPSGQVQTIEVLHDCEHRSELTVRLPASDTTWLDVREVAEKDKTLEPPVVDRTSPEDGGGLATPPSRSVKGCGARGTTTPPRTSSARLVR